MGRQTYVTWMHTLKLSPSQKNPRRFVYIFIWFLEPPISADDSGRFTIHCHCLAQHSWSKLKRKKILNKGKCKNNRNYRLRSSLPQGQQMKNVGRHAFWSKKSWNWIREFACPIGTEIGFFSNLTLWAKWEGYMHFRMVWFPTRKTCKFLTFNHKRSKRFLKLKGLELHFSKQKPSYLSIYCSNDDTP